MIKRRLVTFSFSPQEERRLIGFANRFKIDKSKVVKMALRYFMDESAAKALLKERVKSLETIKEILRKTNAIQNKIEKLYIKVSVCV